ncbi:hypothetical protein HHI36_019523 [Cryptolaemus montrouzieri]|uniref:Beta-1,4-N-acetylgalactosaminyltransferase n=1 Tax=Cryptolaemus montrouzieri TaxID=559131 RepID=A0ABD2P363_9CUCU
MIILCFSSKFKNAGLIIIVSAIIIGIYFPSRHARHYSCVKNENVLDSLYYEQKMAHHNLKNCNYEDVVFMPGNDISIEDVSDEKIYLKPLPGGEYLPTQCSPLLKSAIIVPYRDRPKQLKTFLNYMHHFLQKQKLHYRIFIVDQKNENLFNRAKLLNIGAKLAMKYGFPCLVLHDIDLIPLNYANIYACSNTPRHMSSSLDTFRYNLPYLTIFGGAVAILSEQFKTINGMSNLFEGWGGEDDDLYKRLIEHGLIPCRFCPSISKYTMLLHKKNRKTSESRFNLLKKSTQRSKFDGLNTLNDNFTIEVESLFTHIIVS